MFRDRPGLHWLAACCLLALLCLSLAAVAFAEDPDPAQELYDRANRELNRNRYEEAAAKFHELHDLHRASSLARDALYWEAFARYRLGSDRELISAIEALERLKEDYPGAEILTEARELAVRIEGQLASRGNAEAAERVYRLAEQLDGEKGALSQVVEDDVRIAALNALLHMDEERALPILQRLMERRDTESAHLRSKALFILAQIKGEESQDLLLTVLREDPDPELRHQAMFWLSQMPSDKALAAIEEVLRRSDNPELKEQALFTLSQHDSPRATELLREIAGDESNAPELRDGAIFWLGQRPTDENIRFLKALYGDIDDPGIREKVLFSVAQHASDDSGEWLLAIALDENEDIEQRTQAIFWAGQMGELPARRLHDIYRKADSVEMKEQLIFVLSQQRTSEAVDMLIEIAREEEDLELRSSVIFWIGQTEDPRATEYLEEIINQ